MTALVVEPNSEDWLRERKKHIGASEAAAILGLTPNWLTGEDVAIDKLSDEIKSQSGNEVMRRGHVLEPLIKKFYQLATDCEVFSAPMYIHKEHEWMSATPDGWVITGDMEYLLECKTAFSYVKHEWVDDSYGDARPIVPLKYWVQVQHQMAVTEQERVDVAVLFADNSGFDLLVGMLDSGLSVEYVLQRCMDTEAIQFEVRTVYRDEEFIEKLIGVLSGFWRDIESGVIPQNVTTMDDNGNIRAATAEDETLLAELKYYWMMSERSKRELDKRKDQLRLNIGESSGIKSILGKFTYRKSKDRVSLDWKAIAYELAKQTKSLELLETLKETYTKVSKGVRTLRVPSLWKKELK